MRNFMSEENFLNLFCLMAEKEETLCLLNEDGRPYGEDEVVSVLCEKMQKRDFSGINKEMLIFVTRLILFSGVGRLSHELSSVLVVIMQRWIEKNDLKKNEIKKQLNEINRRAKNNVTIQKNKKIKEYLGFFYLFQEVTILKKTILNAQTLSQIYELLKNFQPKKIVLEAGYFFQNRYLPLLEATIRPVIQKMNYLFLIEEKKIEKNILDIVSFCFSWMPLRNVDLPSEFNHRMTSYKKIHFFMEDETKNLPQRLSSVISALCSLRPNRFLALFYQPWREKRVWITARIYELQLLKKQWATSRQHRSLEKNCFIGEVHKKIKEKTTKVAII